MLRLNLNRLAKYQTAGNFGPVGPRKVGRIPIKKMVRLKKGHFRDFIDERPTYGSKEWVAKQYQDDYVNRPQLEGNFASKQGSKYEVLEQLNKFVRKDDKILNLSFDPSGSITMFIADKVLHFNTNKLSIDPNFLKKLKTLPPQQIPRLVTITDAVFPDKKYFDALQKTNMFQLVQIPTTQFKIRSAASKRQQNATGEHPGAGIGAKLPKLKVRADHFANIEAAVKNLNFNQIGQGMEGKKFTFVIIDPDSSRSKLVGGDSVIMAHVLQSFRIAISNLSKNGRILIKVNGLPGVQTNDRFFKMLSGYFSEVEELELDHLVGRGRIGHHNMDRRDRFLLCSGFDSDLPVPKSNLT